MSGIETFEPGSEEHNLVTETVSKTAMSKTGATVRYNEIANAYNAASLGAYVSITGGDLRMSNLEKVFFNRGVHRDVDYSLFRPTVDVEGKRLHRDVRPVLLQKLTDAVMRTV